MYSVDKQIIDNFLLIDSNKYGIELRKKEEIDEPHTSRIVSVCDII